MLLDAFKAIFNQLYVWLMSFLPNSPFAPWIEQIQNVPFLRYLNWFVPVGQIAVLLTGWLTVIAVFYVYQAIMRYIHLIG